MLELVDWIKEYQCTHVAMESTSVYWKPIVNLLEAEGIQYLVVNASHIKLFLAVRQTLKMPSGLQIYSDMVCSLPATFQIGINGNCVS